MEKNIFRFPVDKNEMAFKIEHKIWPTYAEMGTLNNDGNIYSVGRKII